MFCRVPVQGFGSRRCTPGGLPRQTPLSPRRPLEIRCCVDVKYAEADAGGIWSATRAAKTLHGDTAKHPRRTIRRSFFASPGRAINACVFCLAGGAGVCRAGHPHFYRQPVCKKHLCMVMEYVEGGVYLIKFSLQMIKNNLCRNTIQIFIFRASELNLLILWLISHFVENLYLW